MVGRSKFTICTMVTILSAYLAPIPRLSSLLPSSRRRRHGSTGPESDHLSGSIRPCTRDLTPSFRNGLAPCMAHSRVGAAHPHAEQRVSLSPRISHVSFHFGSTALACPALHCPVVAPFGAAARATSSRRHRQRHAAFLLRVPSTRSNFCFRATKSAAMASRCSSEKCFPNSSKIPRSSSLM